MLELLTWSPRRAIFLGRLFFLFFKAFINLAVDEESLCISADADSFGYAPSTVAVDYFGEFVSLGSLLEFYFFHRCEFGETNFSKGLIIKIRLNSLKQILRIPRVFGML